MKHTDFLFLPVVLVDCRDNTVVIAYECQDIVILYSYRQVIKIT